MRTTKVFSFSGLMAVLLFSSAFLLPGFQSKPKPATKIKVIFDTDANNELDDQHALAYLLFNSDRFDTRGVTVNATKSGGNIEEQYAEALRIMKLCRKDKTIPLLKGSDGNFEAIRDKTGEKTFDGRAAVDFIIREARNTKSGPLTLIAVGKLTNVALAIKKDPGITSRIRLVWLGSNYPEPGEYNQDNDIPAMNYVLASDMPFEMVTVRYGKFSGTDAVKITKAEVAAHMPGLGPKVAPVMGRHQKAFTTFGDYAVNLFEHITYYGTPPSRALFDMAAVAIVKNESWASKKVIPAPTFTDGKWVEQPANKRKITVWENFDRDKIMQDFFKTMQQAK